MAGDRTAHPQRPDLEKPQTPALARGILFTLVLLLGFSAALLSQPRWMFRIATLIQPGALYAVDLDAIDLDAADLDAADLDAADLDAIDLTASRSANESAISKPLKVIALTIDDGPSSDTADILATLAQYDAKATFFNISGNVPGHESDLQQAVAAGHELANHLIADEPSIHLSQAEFEADVLTAEKTFLPYLAQSEQNTLQWLRPGMGFYNAEMVEIAQRHGYRLVLGSTFPYDTHIRSPRFASAFILNTVQPGDIIVLHDGKDNRGVRTVQTLQQILPELRSRGYTITTVTKLTQLAQM